MGMISAMREWPWLMRLTFAIVLLGMALSFIAVMSESNERWMYAIAPAAFSAFGLLLALNVSGAATKYASTTAQFRPLGIDYSNSLFAKPWCARVFGAMMVLVGGGMLFAAVTQPL